MSGGRLRAATGAFSSSLLEASFQFLVNIIDYNMPANDAVSQPRFGTFPYDPAAALTQSIAGTLGANTPNWLDPRVRPDVVATLQKRGLSFVQRQSVPAGGWVDTGMGAVAVIKTVGKPEAATTAWVEMSGPPGAVRTISSGKDSLR
jgi:gamma-glutamyltranspeptidase